MEADVTTPEQGKALALELFDTPVDERGRRHRRRLLAGARTPARRVRRATSRRPVRPVCSLPGALRCEHLTARTGGDFANSAGASPAMAASPSQWPPTCASAPTSSTVVSRSLEGSVRLPAERESEVVHVKLSPSI